MDYAKATKRQLYQIATDHSARMSHRYEAARELQRRKKNMKKEYDRDQLILVITMKTNYAEGYLQNLSDERLLKIYHRVMSE